MVALALCAAGPSFGDLSSRRDSLRSTIGAENQQLQAYNGRLADIRGRLSQLQYSLGVQQSLLLSLQTQLSAARTRLAVLRGKLASGQVALAGQLRAQYESPQPNLVTVALSSTGFADLLEKLQNMKTVAAQNAAILSEVKQAKLAIAAQTVRLADAEARQQRVTAAVLIERDQVASLQLSVLRSQSVVASARTSHERQLHAVEHRLAVLAQQAARAQARSFGLTVPAGAHYSGDGFASHGGDWGFFPAPGTNYSVGSEPQLAARLDALGKALHLHLIGISGYRSPQHSVEVGGFSNDPHTRGEASDTPGVEGVPESVLNQFGLTRPFGGAAEADHIQLA